MTTMTKAEYRTPSDVMEAQSSVTAQVVSPAALVGTWTNIDTATRGLVKVVIATSGTAITVDAFGACSPTPCNWGVVPGLSYSNGVSSTAGLAFSAQYRFGFKQTIVVGHLEGRYLIVETFDTFTDGSGRNPYYSRYQMHK